MTYGEPWYFQYSNSQKADYALILLVTCTSLNIEAAACHHVVNILQHPKSRPSTYSTQNSKVNAPKCTFCPSQLANTANQQSTAHDNIIVRGKTLVAYEA
jgi:hypothetical protein